MTAPRSGLSGRLTSPPRGGRLPGARAHSRGPGSQARGQGRGQGGLCARSRLRVGPPPAPGRWPRPRGPGSLCWELWRRIQTERGPRRHSPGAASHPARRPALRLQARGLTPHPGAHPERVPIPGGCPADPRGVSLRSSSRELGLHPNSASGASDLIQPLAESSWGSAEIRTQLRWGDAQGVHWPPQ